ncbi:MAG TPA: HDOD domain-containing protein [Anaeromyxobacter sp.]|nr:HDOD domain-containing protein [Anaeromyxobacter sp.]
MATFDLDAAIVELVSKGKVKVPPYPAVAFRIEGVVRGGKYGLEDLARLVSSDQVLAADVLRCANSALYSRGTPVASVKAAVGRIGAKDVARLALASGLGAHAMAAGRLSSIRRRAWLDALASALLTQDLARARALPADVAFSAGLLHDFGKVVAIACIEELLQSRDDVAPKVEAEWIEVMDSYHVELGVVMAARWDLPPVIADAISLHHSADMDAAAEPQIVKAVAAVDQVVALLGARPRLEASDLAAIEALTPTERELLAKAVQAVPGFVASFESGEAWAAGTGRSLVAAPPRPEPPAARPSHQVVLRLGDRESTYRLLGIASTHCMVTGKDPIPENLLLAMGVDCDPPLSGYASVKLAWPEPSGWTLLVQPYGLTRGAQARWQQLVGEAERPG